MKKGKITKVILSALIILNTATITNLSALGEADINLALNRNGVVSSTQDATTPTSNAFDGNIGTRWASKAGKDGSGIDETWMYVDLESKMDINKVVISWESRPNKFKIQVSNDLESWMDVSEEVDNGIFEANGSQPAKCKNTIEFETVAARYVRMQGIQRRRRSDENGGASNNTGYSLYEFEVYGPGWNDETFIEQYMKTMNVPSRVYKNFILETSNDEYGTIVKWNSTDTKTISFKENGEAVITRGEEDKEVIISATITHGLISKQKEFTIVVASSQNKEYEIYPIPQNIQYGDGGIVLDDKVNLIFEDSVNSVTKENYTDVLTEAKIEYTQTNTIDDSQVNIIVGVKDGNGIVDEYFEDIKYNTEISTDKDEGYVLNIDSNKNIIAILGSDNAGVKYGSYSLDDILEQGEGIARELIIEDAPDVKFRGFIEGFYGSWSHKNRLSLMEFGGQYKMNTYIYGPKNDEYHYGKWRELYPNDKLMELKELVDQGKKTGVEFVWAAHVGGHTDLSDTDIALLEAKFDQLYSIGVRQFAIFFDDSSTNNTRLVEYMNKIQNEYIDTKSDCKPLIFCPQYYRKQGASESYLKNVAKFDKDIQVMWTGDYVVSEINQSVIDWITNLINRPVYIWWNWPVNDLGRSSLMHLGPTEAIEKVTNMSGLVSNPMNQAQASKVSLYSIADVTWNMDAYHSDASWKSAIKHIITDDEEASQAFQIFAQNCAAAPMSFANTDESVYMQKDLNDLTKKFINNEDYKSEARTVINHFKELKNAITILKEYKGTNNLTAEINQWLDVVYDIADAGMYVVESLDTYNVVNRNNSQSIKDAMEVITTGKEKLKKSNSGHGGKKAAQKVLYPFVENLLTYMEEELYKKIDINAAYKIYGSSKVDYTNAIDGNKESYVTVGQYIKDDYVAVNLGAETKLTDIEIIMQKNNGNNPAYYKKGVLEYSLDNKTWTRISDFDTPEIKVDLDVTARYIRYRAIEEHEDDLTGSNNSNVILKEFAINQKLSAVSYMNSKEVQDLSTIKEDNMIRIQSKDTIVLQPQEYIRTTLDKLKNLAKVSVNNNELTLRVSQDGVIWTEQPINTLKNMTAKYIELSNQTNHVLEVDNITIRLAGKIPLIATLVTNSGDIYSGNINNVYDGSVDTLLWLKRGSQTPEGDYDSNLTRYIQLDLQDVVSLSDMEVIFGNDHTLNGKVDVSLDGVQWETIYTFDKVDTTYQNIKFQGEEARYVRYYMSNGNWLQIKEIYINRLIEENVSIISGDISDIQNINDGNIFTSVKSNQSAYIDFKTANNANPTSFELLKDMDSTVTVKGKLMDSKDNWIDLGTYNESRISIDLSDYDISQLRLSWNEDQTVELHETYFMGEKTLNKTILNNLIEKIKLLEKIGVIDNESQEVKEALNTIKIKANDVNLSSSMTQTQIDSVCNELNLIVQMIKYKDGLNKAINETETLLKNINKNEYTEKTFSALQNALNEAKRIFEKVDASQDEVNQALKTLNEKVKNLQYKNADYTEVNKAIDTANKLNKDDYKDFSGVEKAIASVKKDLDITRQKEVDEMAKIINDAIGLLEKKEVEKPPVNNNKPTDITKPGNNNPTIDSNVLGNEVNTTHKNNQIVTTNKNDVKTSDEAKIAPYAMLAICVVGVYMSLKKKKYE